MGIEPVVILWIRRDLRFIDNRALYEACLSGFKVQLLFIFDTQILDELPADDRRVSLIYNRLQQLNNQLLPHGAAIRIEKGDPFTVFQRLIGEGSVKAVYANEDYEPYAVDRDNKIKALLAHKGIDIHLFIDHLSMSPSAIVKPDGTPYAVYTPWSRKWFELLQKKNLADYTVSNFAQMLAAFQQRFPTIEELGFNNTGDVATDELPTLSLLEKYAQTRDFPALSATSRMSVALRFGLISIRQLLRLSMPYKLYVNELGWREFYAMVLWNIPHVVHRSYKPAYDNILWRNNENEFEKWKVGQTGYPMVDAGMRELLETGFMHNRVRMITASFLTKHLLIDWRWGEAWFAQKLLDFELASNNGGWQWAAGSGCDAAPYFRVFNPTIQMDKFDGKLNYVHRWIPEFGTSAYAKPIVEHKYARIRALETYKRALKS